MPWAAQVGMGFGRRSFSMIVGAVGDPLPTLIVPMVWLPSEK
jgi:hypothetical protein